MLLIIVEFTLEHACRRISHFERGSVAETSAKRFLKGVRRCDLIQIANSICTHSPATQILAEGTYYCFSLLTPSQLRFVDLKFVLSVSVGLET